MRGLVDAVERQGLGRFAGEVDGLGGGLLHLEGQLVAGDPRGQLGVVGARGEVGLVLLAQAIEQQPARRRGRCPAGEARSWIGAPSARRTVAW